MINALDIALVEYLSQRELERQRHVVLARKYHSGEQIVPLTDRLRKVLGVGLALSQDILFRMNVTRSVVTAVSERLIVAGFDAADTGQVEWATNLWTDNRMEYLQEEVHEGALRDSEHFVIVHWDAEKNMPRFTPHERFTSLESGGNGWGCLMKYPEDDHHQAPEYAVKVWYDSIPGPGGVPLQRERRTFYYADRVEKYARNERGELRLLETIPWLRRDGTPLGIPVVHFINKDMRFEAWDAFPMQNAINKTLVDALAAADNTAFRVYVALGFIPTIDGKEPAEDRSNWLTIEPGQIIGTTKESTKVKFDAIDPADIKPLIDLTEQLILWMAMVSDTPVNRFVSTRQIASDKTLKEQEGPLLAKVRNRQLSFGSAWVEALKIARTLSNTFGTPLLDELDETVRFKTVWAEAQTSAERDRLETLEIKKRLGIPRRQLWSEIGYSVQQIETMEGEYRDGRNEGESGFDRDRGTETDRGSGGIADDTNRD